MAYIWDEAKRRSNLKKHKLDFADAPLIFQGITFTFEDERLDYSEPRFITIGQLEIIVVVVVHTDRNGDIRIISMRNSIGCFIDHIHGIFSRKKHLSYVVS